MKGLALDIDKFTDERRLYQEYKDLNDWLMLSRQHHAIISFIMTDYHVNGSLRKKCT